MESESPSPHPRRRSPWAVTVVAAAVLAAGGGGAYWAASDAQGGTPRAAGGGVNGGGATASPPPLELDGTVHGPVGEPALKAALPAGPSSAAVQRPGTVSRAAVEKLARALGVPGTVRSDHGVWRAGGTPDGGGPALRVSRQAPGDWAYSRYAASPQKKRFLAPGGDAVSEERALREAAPVLAALGLKDARTDASESAGALRKVTADPKVAGLPTHGWLTALTVGHDGVVAAHGMMAPLTRGDTYPVVSAKESLEQLRHSGTGGDLGLRNCPTVIPQKSRAPGEDPALPRQLPCVPSGPRGQEARGAEFGLSAQFVAGRRALVPSWLFTLAQPGVRGTWVLAQPAVDPAYVRSGPRGRVPAPSQTVPGSPGSPGLPGSPGSSGLPGPGTTPRTGTGTETGTAKVESYAVEDSKLTLVFWGGVCSSYAATADDSGRVVEVRVTSVEKNPGSACILIAKKFTRTVPLDRPLGDRKVVDLHDGSTVPPA
ncbi:hypothetical protein ACFWVC_28010 [Streptomyces sp. NPDC058691]|uniref:hypothetical protein n=1 Tax=Streptomyces sp. NPDC058691 TaxID=3346601 RepID=UPI003665A71E